MIKKFELLFRKLLMSLLLLISGNKIRNDELPKIDRASKILFIRLNRIGDALVSTPIIDLVKKKIGCKIYVLADQKNSFVFKNNPHIDDVFVLKKNIKSLLSINKLIKQNGINVLVDLHDDVSTTVSFIIALANCDYKLGLKKNNFKLYTQTIDRIDSDKHHVIDRILEIGKLLGIKFNKDEVKVGYYPKESSVLFAKDFISQTFKEKKFLLGINISAGSDARFWGVDNFVSLLKELRNYPVNILIFADPKDIEKANSISTGEIIYPVTKDFDKFAAGILELDMLFSPDTSAIHIASIKRIPVFGLYVKFNTNDMIWSPYNTEFDCIVTEESSLANITFEEVKRKFIPFLEVQINAKRNPKL